MTDSGHDTKLGSSTDENDEVTLEDLRRLSAKFVAVEREPDSEVKEEQSEDALGIIERLAGQHQSMDAGVGRVLFRVRLLMAYCYVLLLYGMYTQVQFYRHLDSLDEYAPAFRAAMSSFIVLLFVLANIVFGPMEDGPHG